MDTIDPKMAKLWAADSLEKLMIELSSEKAKVASWARHCDELDKKFVELCEALYIIMSLEDHEIENCTRIAKQALNGVGR